MVYAIKWPCYLREYLRDYLGAYLRGYLCGYLREPRQASIKSWLLRRLSIKSNTRRVLACFSVAASLSLTSFAHALEKVTYQLDWLPGGDKAPIYAGIQQGFFKDVGIEVKISSGRGSTDALTKLATTRSDIGSAGLGNL